MLRLDSIAERYASHAHARRVELATLRPRHLVMTIVVGYALTVPWPGYYWFEPDTRLLIYNARPLVVASGMGVLLAALVLAPRSPLRWALRRPARRDFALLNLAFPVAYLAFALPKATFSLPTFGLYLLWGLGFGLVMPTLVRSRRDLCFLARGIFLVGAANVLHALAFGPELGTFDVEDRSAHGYVNPNYFAQLVQVTLVALSVAVVADDRRTGRGRRWFVALVWLGGGALVALAVSRNVMVALVTLLCVYVLLRARRRVRTLGAVPVLALVGLLALDAATADRDTLDDLSSHRISLWEHHLDGMFEHEDQLATWLTGPSAQRAGVPVATYDDVAAAKTYTKTRVDNFFFEQLLEAGLIGLILALAPFIAILRRGTRYLWASPNRSLYAWLIAFHVATLVQGLFTATTPTFNSPLGIAILAFGSAPFFFRSPARARSEQVESR